MGKGSGKSGVRVGSHTPLTFRKRCESFFDQCSFARLVIQLQRFCTRGGITYVSCSPYRVPVARLAAAQAAIEEKRKAKPAKKK